MKDKVILNSTANRIKKSNYYNPLAQPFLKWAGGKRKLILTIKKYLPKNYNKYYEPFVGAGAVLFYLQPRKTLINDTNWELINCYHVIKENPEELLKLCQRHQENNSKEYYYKLREKDRDSSFKNLSSVERAARIIYLNKTCFNGLFRVNSHGQFNVPYGDYSNPVIADSSVIMAVNKFLNQKSVEICKDDFQNAVTSAKKGDFIYFDPPYHPISNTSSFTGYNINGFGEKEQERLKLVCDQLSDRGCYVLVSNSDTPFIRELYGDYRYKIEEVKAGRAINAVGSKRGKIGELLIHNQYECKSV
ncbi:DNA adenine methylase [Dactylococcopsis salina]|uniref:Site-specific DNA-methyltransferase (adenine-specific) n=1 Tax=Dactylococcopsis salina (strain PCC 8305) TaxID=13035 RepID=K9YPG2_DACS8|nr:DNA adenine methylase [Dactylococcopsis salina]AFZ48831.1 DNA adenine methylase Dam [Dactylococcopsis salina PCC 8305]